MSQDKPLESVRLECCGYIHFIPIREERDFLNFYKKRYKYPCPHCEEMNPDWSWPSSKSSVKLIKLWSTD